MGNLFDCRANSQETPVCGCESHPGFPSRRAIRWTLSRGLVYFSPWEAARVPGKYFSIVIVLVALGAARFGHGQTTKLIVAYASPAATFCPGWIARREGIFAKYDLDVEMVLMQGASTYMPALASGNNQVLYGGGTAVSRAIATGCFVIDVAATETRYVPLRLMVNGSIRTPADLKGKRIGAGL